MVGACMSSGMKGWGAVTRMWDLLITPFPGTPFSLTIPLLGTAVFLTCDNILLGNWLSEDGPLT